MKCKLCNKSIIFDNFVFVKPKIRYLVKIIILLFVLNFDTIKIKWYIDITCNVRVDTFCYVIVKFPVHYFFETIKTYYLGKSKTYTQTCWYL